MPEIRMRSLQDALGGAEPGEAVLHAQLFSVSVAGSPTPAVRVVDETVLFPSTVFVKLTGEEEVVVLDREPENHWWRFDFRSDSALYRINVIFPEGDGPFDLDEMIRINPKTYEPLPDAPQTIQDAIDARLLKDANLSDLTDPAEAVVNLGLGDVAPRPPAWFSGSNPFDQGILDIVITGDMFVYDSSGENPGWVYQWRDDAWQFVIDLQLASL